MLLTQYYQKGSACVCYVVCEVVRCCRLVVIVSAYTGKSDGYQKSTTLLISCLLIICTAELCFVASVSVSEDFRR